MMLKRLNGVADNSLHFVDTFFNLIFLVRSKIIEIAIEHLSQLVVTECIAVRIIVCSVFLHRGYEGLEQLRRLEYRRSDSFFALSDSRLDNACEECIYPRPYSRVRI